MPANGRWDLIRRLKVNNCVRSLTEVAEVLSLMQRLQQTAQSRNLSYFTCPPDLTRGTSETSTVSARVEKKISLINLTVLFPCNCVLMKCYRT